MVRGNYCHDIDGLLSGEHLDFVQNTGGAAPTLAFSLIENNIEQNCLNDGGNCHFVISRTGGVGVSDTLIIRYNYAQKMDGMGFDIGGVGDDVPNCHAYNNTVATEAKDAANGSGATFYNAAGGVALNNIFYDTTAGGWSPVAGANANDIALENGNLTFTVGYSGTFGSPYSTEATYASLHSIDPKFANYPADDSLQATSPAIGAGAALTTVAAGDSGSGTSLLVKDAHFFQPGWGNAQADWIAVGSAGNVVQIVSINYAVNAITLAMPISRKSGDPVYLFKDSSGRQVLYGSAPDIGAYPNSSDASSQRIFYIDFAGGSDSNNGISKTTPWKRAPGMSGFAGSYSLQDGDTFIFKGGVTWTGVYQWSVSGGSSSMVTYSTDHTWYSGLSWSQPVFDDQSAVPPTGPSGGMLNGSSYVTLNDLKFINCGTAGVFTNDECLVFPNASNVALTNLTLQTHNWISVYFPFTNSGSYSNITFTGNDVSGRGLRVQRMSKQRQGAWTARLASSDDQGRRPLAASSSLVTVRPWRRRCGGSGSECLLASLDPRHGRRTAAVRLNPAYRRSFIIRRTRSSGSTPACSRYHDRQAASARPRAMVTVANDLSPSSRWSASAKA